MKAIENTRIIEQLDACVARNTKGGVNVVESRESAMWGGKLKGTLSTLNTQL